MSDAALISSYELFVSEFEKKGFSVRAEPDGIFISQDNTLGVVIKLQTVQEMDTFYAGLCAGLRIKGDQLCKD